MDIFLDMDVADDVVIVEEALAVRTLVPSGSSSCDSTATSVGVSSPMEVRSVEKLPALVRDDTDWREAALWKDSLLLLERTL